MHHPITALTQAAAAVACLIKAIDHGGVALIGSFGNGFS